MLLALEGNISSSLVDGVMFRKTTLLMETAINIMVVTFRGTFIG